MSNNLENERPVSSSRMYPIDLAPQKITIVKNNAEIKVAHLIPGQTKTTGSGILTHSGSVGLIRPSTQIVNTSSITTQTQMMISGSPIVQATQLSSQSSQIVGQTSQTMSSNTQMLSPGTQIISQGTQLSMQMPSSGAGSTNVQVTMSSSMSGSQVLNMSGQILNSSGGLVVTNPVRSLPASVRVIPPLSHNNRTGLVSNVNVSSVNSVSISKSVTSHVPRGLAAGASLAMRPSAPLSHHALPSHGGVWPGVNRGVRGALVYGVRGAAPPAPRPPQAPRAPSPSTTLPSGSIISSPLTTSLSQHSSALSIISQHSTVHAVSQHVSSLTLTSHPVSLTVGRQNSVLQNSSQPMHQPHSNMLTLPTTTVITSSGVISNAVRGSLPRPTTPSYRPLPLLQRNYQTTKQAVPVVVGNSAPPQLYYEVPRAPSAARHAAPYAHAQPLTPLNMNQPLSESRASLLATQPRPTILRKRDIEGSPAKASGGADECEGEWGGAEERAGSGGSTTVSAASSPEPEPPRVAISPRKKPRKQMLTNEIRQYDYQPEDTPSTPPPVSIKNPPKRLQLKSSYVCGWRGTALHFVRPAEVRPRAPPAAPSPRATPRAADGWKVHHLTAQMDDLMSLESDVGVQLERVLRSVENATARPHSTLRPHAHTLLELVKGNMQRSQIVCESIQEARDDILRVFKHKSYVSDILSRQPDKRSFRKNRLQS